MAVDCVTCGKSTTVDGAVFCTYCGQKLHDPHATVSHTGSSESSLETVPDAAPKRVGAYRIVRQLGEGGMGTVFEAEADETGKRVAVKVLSKKLAANPISVERFRQEGRLASQISHPRCVFVYHADADAGRPFIVMELMPGLTLKDVVEKHGKLSPSVAVARILDVIDGLIEAHRLGLIHRDVKPSNCFLTADDRVKIGDFGLSKSLVESESNAQLTGTGAFLGTVLYAPPEQIRGEEVSYDSDVYSVCATLYYLLTARAPYQHESMTAALAKAISEPPPSIRNLRPDVPKVLERVVKKGLERDRGRRYASLEELRDALQQLLPEEQIPARTRMLIAAYAIDSIVMLLLVQLPIELLERLLNLKRLLFSSDLLIDPFQWVAYILAFAACEGFAGATVGKWLLGLRVVPHGSVGPPGFGLATLRSTFFHVGWLLVVIGFELMASVAAIGLPLGMLLVLGGIGFLAYRQRTPTANRGLHDRITGCHVVQMPRRPHRVRLASHGPNRLDHAVAVGGLPATLGGYTVRGRLMELRDGSQVFLADDRSLGRRVLLHLKPSQTETVMPPIRPNRLRLLTSGELKWQKRNWTWHAFAAPAGAPLADMIPAERLLNWPDARLLLEQIVEELLSAEADGTKPEMLSVNHLWCEPGGRMFVLEFPVPSSAKVRSVSDSLDLVRQAATLILEGAPRADGARLQAPLPPRASEITNRLFDSTHAFADLHELQNALGASHAHEPRVTTKMRATQLGFAAVLLVLPLLLLLMYTQFVIFMSTIQKANLRMVAAGVLARIDQPEIRGQWQKHEALQGPLSDEQLSATRLQLAALRDHRYAEFLESMKYLSRPERFLAVKQRDRIDAAEQYLTIDRDLAAQTIRWAQTQPGPLQSNPWDAFEIAISFCCFFLVIFAVFAFAFRGGLSYLLSGITLVRGDGRRAGRFRCAFREIALWLPLMLALLLAAWIQTLFPGHFVFRLVSSGLTVGVIIAYMAIGFRSPEQGPHDRFIGTWRVPV